MSKPHFSFPSSIRDLRRGDDCHSSLGLADVMKRKALVEEALVKVTGPALLITGCEILEHDTSFLETEFPPL